MVEGDLIWIVSLRGGLEWDQVAAYGRLWRVVRVSRTHDVVDMCRALPFHLTAEEYALAVGFTERSGFPWAEDEYEPYVGQTEEQADG